jgi:hypothetical protein
MEGAAMSFPPLLRQASCAAVLAAPLVWAPAFAKQPKQNMPFNVTVVTTEQLISPEATGNRCSPLLMGMTTGTGAGSLLGKFTLSASDCILPGAPIATDPAYGPVFGSYDFSSGQLVFTAANGDLLYGQYAGTLSLLPTGQNLLLYSVDGRITFAGGTGRFADASGSGHLGGVLNLVTQQGQFDVTATLSH